MKQRSRSAASSSLLSVVLFASVSIISPLEIAPRMYEEQLLWVSGVEGEVNSYRIPLLTVTSQGSLLAFAEARKLTRGDIGTKFIAVRRSTDRGDTWSPTTFISDDVGEADGLNLGSVVVDQEWGSVILIYTICVHICHPSVTMMVESKDDGLSWGVPKDLSTQLNITTFVPGPGFGIQKRYPPHKGRLVVCGHGKIEGDGVFCILSDNHGVTWQHGGVLKSIPYIQPKKALDFNPDECQPVEMTDGSIIINMRNQNSYHCRCRIVVRSYDGGSSLLLDDMFFDYALVDPVVAAGLLQKKGVLFFTNPSNEHYRVNLTLRWSMTNGRSWENKTFQIWPGPSGYSSITSMDSDYPDDEKYIFVIYEKGEIETDETISFAKIHLYGGL